MHACIIHIWKTIIRQGILAVCFLSLHLHQRINSSCGHPEFIAKSQDIELQAIRTLVTRRNILQATGPTEKRLMCLLLLHGTGVDQVVVVAFICQAEDYNLLQPYGIRELCLMDNRLVNSFLSVIHQYCME